MTDINRAGIAPVSTTAAPGLVSMFLTTVPVDELDRYRTKDHEGATDDGLEADSGLIGVDVEMIEVDGFAEPVDNTVAEIAGYSAGESFAVAAALDLARAREDGHTGLVLVYDHDARQGAGQRAGSGLTLVGVYPYSWPGGTTS